MLDELSKPRDQTLAHYMEPTPDPARERNIWGGVSARLEERHVAGRANEMRASRWFVPAALSFAAAVAALSFFAWSAPRGPSALEGAALVTSADELDVSLVDGSVVEVAPRSRVRVTSASAAHVRLDLAEGRVSCDVAKDPQRAFEVVARGVRVRVVGTKFSVENRDTEGRVLVVVERGVVEVMTPDGALRRLGAGESWQYGAKASEPRAVRSAEGESEPVAGARPASNAVVEPRPTEEPISASPTTRSSVGQAPKSEETEDMFVRAVQARQRGAAAEAAKLFGDFATRHPADARSGAAWFELGRLRMDRLGDRVGAEQALARAVAAGVGPLTDDALARLVRARESLGMLDACRSARAAYMRRFSSGVHIDEVRRRCPD